MGNNPTLFGEQPKEESTRKKMVYAQTGAEMKFPGCCYFDETQPLPLLSPGASGQPAWDDFTFKNTHKHATGIEILCFTLMNAAH